MQNNILSHLKGVPSLSVPHVTKLFTPAMTAIHSHNHCYYYVISESLIHVDYYYYSSQRTRNAPSCKLLRRHEGRSLVSERRSAIDV